MSDRTRILIVGGGNVEAAPDGRPVTKAPIADYLHEMADRLGHCVWLVQRSGTFGVGMEGTSELSGHLDPARVTVVPIDSGFRGTLRNWRLLFRYARSRPYAVFFLPACTTLAPVLPLVRFFFPRLAVYLAGDYILNADEAEAGRWFGWRRLFIASYEISMWCADFVIARGAFLADEARRSNSRVVETVPLGHILGAEPNDTAPIGDKGPRSILYVGLLVESKGLIDLMTALRMIADRREGDPIELDVLGEGPDRPLFEEACERLGLSDSVHFRGWVEVAEEMNAYFLGADALVMPSSTHPEGVPRSIDEALVRLVPVVATRIAGVPAEFPTGEVILVDTAAPEQLADAIEGVLFDPEVRAAAIEGARRRRDSWTAFESAADQHAKLLLGEAPID